MAILTLSITKILSLSSSRQEALTVDPRECLEQEHRCAVSVYVPRSVDCLLYDLFAGY